MIVTSIIRQEKAKKNWEIYIDNVYAFTLSADEVLEFQIKEGMEIDSECITSIMGKLQYKKAMEKAIKLISVRSRSEYEVRKKLKSEMIDNAVIDEIVGKLKELQYLNDMDFARQWVEQRKASKMIGKRKLVSELKNKGIDDDIVNKVIDREDDDLETAIKLIKKRMKHFEYKSYDIKAEQRMYRYLISKGIGYETAHKALKSCLVESADNYRE